MLFVGPPRLASTSCLPRYLDELPRALPCLPCVERRGSATVAKVITLSCSRLPRRLGGPRHDRRGAYFVHRTACGAGFLGLSSAQNTSLSRRGRLQRGHIRVIQAILGWTSRNCSFWAHTISLVAVPVLAPWRAPTCWGPVMSGNLQRRTNARERGRMQPLCKESRHVLILSKSGHKSRAAIARPIESSRPIETAYRSQPDPKSAARYPKNNEVVRHRQKETRERRAPGG